MFKRIYLLTICAAISCFVTAAHGKTLVTEFAGNANATTAEFDVQAPWLVDWRVTSEYKSGLTIEVSLVEAGTGLFVGYVLNTTGTGNGVKLFKQSGRYYFRVTSNIVNWTLRVEEVSEEEARLYTPKEPSG
jgi:hypothetical protein